MKITEATWMVLDTETTGLKPKEGAQVIELGWCIIKSMAIEGSANFLINPGKPIPPEITKITGISDADVQGEPMFGDIAGKFFPEYSSADFILAYNAKFDRDMLEAEFTRIGSTLPQKLWLDPLIWARTFAQNPDNKLASMSKQFGVSLERAHRADADAAATAEIAMKFFQWGVEEAAFPDDVDQLKQLERGWRAGNMAKSSREKSIKNTMTGEPGQYAQNVFDNYNRDRLMKLANRGRWGK